ncbi:MAG: carboxypeptidase-like regulatory domain-containing protein, partial [Blastocatellia bacterium]
MSRMNLLRAAGVAVATLCLTAVISAQSGQVEGNIKLKAADGTVKGVAGALIDIYRLDIKGHYDVKTDKNGHFVRLGLPLQGTYLFVVSGPGIAPTYMNNVR